MKWLLIPRPLSIWLNPIEVGVMAALVGSAAILFFLVRIDKRTRRIERVVTTL